MDASIYLEKLDGIFDVGAAADIAKKLEKATRFESGASGRLIRREVVDNSDWPIFDWADIIQDGWHDKYLLRILGRMVTESKAPRFLTLWSVPAGRGLWGSMFGAELKYASPGNVWVFPPKDVTIDDLIERGVPDVSTAGISPLIQDVSRFFLDRLANYENLSKLQVNAIDSDGVLETAMGLFGQTIFEDMLLRPDVVKRFFDILLETQSRYCAMIRELFKPEIEQGRMFMFDRPLTRGGFCRVVEDSAVMLSPDLYGEFCRPYNEAMFARFASGEGCLHFCGDGNAIIDAVLETKGLRCLHPGQANFYDIENLYPKLADKKVAVMFKRLAEWSDDDVEKILRDRSGVAIV